MKILSLAAITLLLINCNATSPAPGKDATVSTGTAATSSSATSSSATEGNSGFISCTLNAKEWKNNNAIATQTGKAFLNIASDEDQKEAISIILNHPAIGTLNFNQNVNGSYTDPTGKSYGSKDGSGSITVTSYTPPPDNKTAGSVSGTFSGTFSFDPKNMVVVTNGKFSMPVKKL
ncbi:MAG: hypothetical protein ABJB86_08675 [Bacteroidota bacterium]